MRLVFAGTPSRRAAVAARAARRPGTRWSPWSPGRTRRPGAGGTLARSPVGALADGRGHPGAHAGPAAGAGLPGRLAALAPDCCPVVAYGALVPPAALDIPRHGWVNLHFSLLPAWRGAAPVQHAVLHGDEITGATTFQLEEGLDTGPVYGVVTEPIRPRDTAGDLLDRLAAAGAGLLVAHARRRSRTAPSWRAPQPADGVSLAPKITVEDARVRLGGAGVRGRPADPGLHAGARGVDHVPRRAAQARPGAAGAGRAGARPPGELLVEKRRVLVGTATTRSSWARCSRRASGRCRRADWARGARVRAGGELPTSARPRPTPAVGRARRDRRGRPARRRRRPPAGRRTGTDPAGAAAGGRPGPAGRATTCCAPSRARRVREPDPAGAAARARLTGRDAALATELAYGTLRAPGTLDAVILAAAPTARLERWTRPRRTRCGWARTSCCTPGFPPHAAVVGHRRPGPGGARRAAGFVNAVLRRVARRTETLGGRLAPDAATTRSGTWRSPHAHPRWIVPAFADALGGGPAPRPRRRWRRTTPGPPSTWWPGRAGSTADRAGRAGRRRPGRLLAVRGAAAVRRRSRRAGRRRGRAGRRPGRGQPAGARWR